MKVTRENICKDPQVETIVGCFRTGWLVWLGGNERKIVLDEVEPVGRSQIVQALWATVGWIFFFLYNSFIGIEFTCHTIHPFQVGVWILY